MSSQAAWSNELLLETRRAFDGVADDYDGPTGNNELIQRMRERLWRAVEAVVPPGGRLLDLGCGTGLDASHFARGGYRVVAVDWSPAMVRRTQDRACASGRSDPISAHTLGIHELGQLSAGRFDGIYSDLGPLNCLPDLTEVARACANLLQPGGWLVVSVIGRRCPWEQAYYLLRGDWRRAWLRESKDMVPVRLRGETVWTRYLTPTELAAAFAEQFDRVSYRALGLLVPPPHLVGLYQRLGPVGQLLGALDDRLGSLPLLRDGGDHFLMVLKKRD
jgi:2-polyprenyl-3-methyl-5-hydroxy-6-metoxy-1,4-benzoquinol methylase